MKRINLIMLMIASTMMMSCKQDNKIAGHEYVDLGLPSGLKWASCNVGANSPEEYGDYFAWGETETKSEYTEDNCLTCGLTISELQAQGIIDGNNLTPQHDAATANWGGSWRMPTREEYQELLDNCTFEWTGQDGLDGCCKVTSKTNGNSIILPASGFCEGSLTNDGMGFIWSAEPNESNDNIAYCLFFVYARLQDGGEIIDFNLYKEEFSSNRSYGHAVRPVSE